MRRLTTSIFASFFALVLLSAVPAFAQNQGQDTDYSADDNSLLQGGRVTLSGGIMGMNDQSPFLDETFINIPVALELAYDIAPAFAIAGSFTWFIPTNKSIDLDDGTTMDLKSPDILAYMGNVHMKLPLESGAISPYLTAGAGGISFLETNDANRSPQLSQTQTMFGANFGAGISYAVAENWAVRADVREFVGFPQKDSQGFDADGNSANPLWMTRGTLGLSLMF